MHRNTYLGLIGLCLVGCAGLISPANAAGANATPFFAGGGSSFDPEISVVNSGVVLDAQGVVSPDRKYVTMNMRPTNTSLLALRDFTFQTPGTGFVGMPTPPAPAATAKGARQPVKAAPVNTAPIASPTILQRPGMIRIDNRN